MKILKKLSFLIGMPFTGILLMIMIIAMALATFVESGQGTNAAWALIYDAWWFELLFVLVLINLVGNIFKMKLYRRSKLTIFVFHLAFAFIIIGGGITRYFATEGMMHIREGSMSGTLISDDTYMDIQVSDGEGEISASREVRLSVLTPRKFRWKGELNGKKIRVRSMDYMKNAMPQYVAAPGGKPYIQMVLLAGRQISVGLTSGEEAAYPGITLSFDQPVSQADLQVVTREDQLYAVSAYPVSITSMEGAEMKNYAAGEEFILEQQQLYSLNNISFALQRFIPSAVMKYVEAGSSGHATGVDVVRLEVNLDGMKSELFVHGQSNLEGEPASVTMGSTTISCAYGSKEIQLPFVLRLQDFRIDRYPGSHSPSSFESDVVLIDVEKNISELRNIYMNNVLKHRFYRFYQSSYDQDELGTILSVKRDVTGTSVTYVGYILLIIGMVLALFAKGTRFSALSRSTSAGRKKVTMAMLAFLLVIPSINAQEYPVPSRKDAADFGKIWVQGKEGRFKPMNTLSNEVMRKVVKKSHFEGHTDDQVMLGMIVYPDEWKQAPIFEVDNPQLHQMIGFKGSLVSFNDFIVDGRYVLSSLVNEAYKKRVQDRTDLDKEVMKLDEKINVFYMVQTGALLKIFPDPDDENGSWLAVSELLNEDQTVTDTLGQVFLLYTRSLRDGDTQMSAEILDFINRYQAKNTLHPLNEKMKKAEIYYNKVDLFNRLVSFYGLFGFIMVFLQFFRIFQPRKWVEYMFRVGIIHLAVAFALHTGFFLLRWYVSGHAPLSNGYESMIFVSWITLLAGLIFVRRTGFALGLTAILSMLALLVAHMSWMNPDITNLVPVLKSPWLTIHVTVIMAGYGFLGMSMLMGLINLVFFTILNQKNRKRITEVLDQVTKVNHLSMIIGLYFLTIGTFLGGVWANESWGRYWGWDPKETWALISVLVYTFIVHMHRFPGMKGTYAFNLGSLLGYFSILMTYFGVNYFLGGIHSYAGGAAFAIPFWVYLIVLAILTLSIIAYNKQNVLKQDYLPES